MTTFNTDSTYFSNDTVEVAFDVGESEFEKDDSGELVDFSLDSDRIVSVNNPPWQQAFDTDKFFVVDATVARPIPQKYVYNNDVYTFKKPADELQKAAWSLDNKPFTVGHPDSGRVRGVQDARGFWKEPSYDVDNNDLNAEVYVPVNDEDALEYISENSDVSVGFSHALRASDEDGIDAYQVDMYFDHVAAVKNGHGRCSGEDGCGIDVSTDSVIEVCVDSESLTALSKESEIPIEELDGVSVQDSMTYEISPYDSFTQDSVGTQGVYFESDFRDEDGKYYAVSPEEGRGEPKFPIANCSDAEDAWKLRNHGDIDISVETLEQRIKRRATELDCSGMPWQDSENDSQDTNMTDSTCDCGDGGGDGFDISVDTLSIDALASRHDGVQEVLEQVDELEGEVEEYKETVDEKENRIEELEDTVDEYEETIKEYRQDERDGIVEEITSLTDTWDEDELRGQDLESLKEKHEVAKDIAEDVGVANADGDATDGDTEIQTERVVDPTGNFSR